MTPERTPSSRPGPAGEPEPLPSRPAAVAFHPGLEGLRGLAVAAVLLFHGGFTRAEGGFLGVSTFFTLSGFLITGLLLRERDRRGAVGMRAFWARRARRLLPAALAAIALACTYTVVAGDALQRQRLAGDAVACLAYVANWRFLFTGQSYAALFSRPSALLQFWSVAIEEQFYLIFPLICVGVLVGLRRTRRDLTLVVGVLFAASFALALSGHLSQDGVYYGTETRAAELLVGALLALVVNDERVRHLATTTGRAAVAAATVGTLGLIATIACWILVTQQTSWLYRGGLSAYAVLSATVILAAIAPIGPVRWLLASRPLRWLGLISYGVYLYHWPIFQWVSPDTTGRSADVLFVPRVALTLLVAVASFVWLERPIRRGERFVGVRPSLLVGPAMALVALFAVLVTVTAPALPIDFEAEQSQLVAFAAQSRSTAQSSGLPRVSIFGDSTAVTLGLGLTQVLQADRSAVLVSGGAKVGCALVQATASIRGGVREPLNPRCSWEDWKPALAAHPNLVIVLYGPWDTAPTQMPGDHRYRVPGDPKYDVYLQREMVDAVDLFAADGADVVWLTSPPVGTQANADTHDELADLAHPERMTALDRLVEQLPRLRPGKVQVVDLASWYASISPDDAAMRPDGIHFTPTAAIQVSQQWLARAVMRAYWENRLRRSAPARAPSPP